MLTEFRHYLIERLAGKDVVVLNVTIKGELQIDNVKGRGLVANCTFTQPEEKKPDEWMVLTQTVGSASWLRNLSHRKLDYMWELFMPRMIDEVIRRGGLRWWAVMVFKLIWPTWQFKTGEVR